MEGETKAGQIVPGPCESAGARRRLCPDARVADEVSLSESGAPSTGDNGGGGVLGSPAPTGR